MAMAVQQRALGDGRERQAEAAGLHLAREKLLKHQGLFSELAPRFPGDDPRDLVAEAEQAARLEPDDRYAAREVWRERGQHPLRLMQRFVHLADRQERAAAAQRPAAVRRRCDVHAIAAGGEHRERSVDGLALEVTVKGINK